MWRWALCSGTRGSAPGDCGRSFIAHGVIDTAAFVGYTLLAGHLGWLK